MIYGAYNTEEELIKWLEDDLEEQSEAWQSKIIKFLFCGLLRTFLSPRNDDLIQARKPAKYL